MIKNKDINVLDCTLRDGAYLIDAKFGDELIKGIIRKCTEAKIDVVECGFLKDEEHTKDSTVFSKPSEVIPYLPRNDERGNTSFVLLADYSRYKAVGMEEYDGTSIDGVRECFQKFERKDAMRISKIMKEKGYKVYIQPVDILGYSDEEILDLIKDVNEIKPYAFSIVDTFGSMYEDDLVRIYSLINHNLDKETRIGFHSHNNLQMSFALSQKFISIAKNDRKITIDATICGMGRGAGNTNTELVVNYLVQKMDKDYDLDKILDIVDIYMPEVFEKCQWGYTVPIFIAGKYNTHVHNITYLLGKHNINSKDLRAIIEKIDPSIRKTYDYDNLESVYVNHFSHEIDDSEAIGNLSKKLYGKRILLLAPGNSLDKEKEKIYKFIDKENPIIISINGVYDGYTTDYAFFSNFRRFEYAITNDKILNEEIIITSNIEKNDCNAIVVNYASLLQKGHRFFDNSTIMLLNLLAKIGIKEAFIAGFDGYDLKTKNNFQDKKMQIRTDTNKFAEMNREIPKMLKQIQDSKGIKLVFITNSLYCEGGTK